MELRIFVEPQQGAGHADLLEAARATLAHGFGAFFRSDHVLTMGGDGLPGPTDSMVSLAALAAQVPGIRLGTLVNSATFRHPGMLAIAAANIDDISGGRLELGMGSGWFEAEHAAYGLPFGSSFGERFDRLTEQLEILTGLWATPIGSTFDHAGQHYQLAGAPGLPKPVQKAADGSPRIPLIVGGHGPKRTPALAARFADEFNCGFSDTAVTRTQFDRVRSACEAIDRDPSGLVYSAAQTTICGATPEEVRARALAVGRADGEPKDGDLAGAPEQILERLQEFAAAGVQRMYLQCLDVKDLEHIALLGETVLTEARGL